MYHNNGKKIVATIEARMGSSRLPGKMLFPILERPILQHLIERMQRSKYVDEVVVATTENVLDNEIVEFCQVNNFKYYRGSEEDVLLRVLNAAKAFQADIIVEICGDCPVIDWRHIDKSIEVFFSGDYDYVSNDIEKTFPIGLRVQVFPVSVLERVNQLTDSEVDDQHVTLYIYSNPEHFKIMNWRAEGDMNHPEIEITLDTAEDYELIKFIFNKLYPKKNDFTALDVVNLFLDNPDIKDYTKNIIRKDVLLQKENEEQETNPIFNVLIIGAGNIGAFDDFPDSENILTHAHAFTKHSGFNLVGFVDIDTEKAKEAAKIWSTSYFKSIKEVFNKFTIDVVCVAVPDDVHHQILMKILNYPFKFVFIEKPISKNLLEAESIIKKYTSKKIHAAVNYRRRYVPEFLNIKFKILNGDYGAFLGGIGYYTKGLIHNGSHLLELLLFLIGKVEGATPIQKKYDYYEDDPSISAVLNFSDNKLFFLKALNFRIYDIFEIDLFFEKKRLRLIDSGNKIEEYNVKSNPILKRYQNLIKTIEYETSLKEALYNAAQNIYDFLIDGKEIYCTMKHGYDVLKLCLELKKKI